jgi:hypothetical protein
VWGITRRVLARAAPPRSLDLVASRWAWEEDGLLTSDFRVGRLEFWGMLAAGFRVNHCDRLDGVLPSRIAARRPI